MPPPLAPSPAQDTSRARKLQLLGILSGFTAGAWLGAAEAPTKLVSIGLSPIVISLIMVVGVFLARWSVPALILGTSSVRADIRRAPHLIIWALLAGCLWAVANTMTIFAIRDIGLSIAFPLWNSNSLLGILWGFLFFNELRQAGWRRWLGVLGGALVMCAGATLLAIASSGEAPAAHSMRGVWAALGAGILWGTMYIPYRKAYLSGMNPLSFVTFFTFGELGMMSALAIGYLGLAPLWHQLQSARDVIFWLMLGGFIWVIGDLFQQYAAKYVGISRGIPLLMMAGVAAISFSSATSSEQTQWKQAAHREGQRYNIEKEYVDARMDGRQSASEAKPMRTAIDWLLVGALTAAFIYFAATTRLPQLAISWPPALILTAATLALLLVCGVTLHRTTRFH